MNAGQEIVVSAEGRPRGAGSALEWSRWRWASLFTAVGMLALGTQIYLLREYMVALGGDEAAIGLGLSAWLVGIAAGAVLAQGLAIKRSGELAAAAIASLAASGYLEMLVARIGRSLLHIPIGELLPLGPSLELALFVFVFPGAMVGVAFVAIAASATSREPMASATIGKLYVFEAIGSLAAGVLVSLVLVLLMRPCVGLACLLVLGLIAAMPAAWAGLIGGRRSLALLAAALLLAGLTPVSASVERATQRARFVTFAQGGSLLDWVDTPYEYLAIGSGEVRNLYAGGVYVRSIPDFAEDESLAHQLMLLNPQPNRVLALGGIEMGLLRFCLRHPVQRLDLVVLDRQALEFVAGHLEEADREALADPRVHLHFQDPRRFLASHTELFDLILLLERDPATLYLARETTTQFVRLLADHLALQGTYAMRFSAGPNVQAGETGLLGASLFRTLREIFPVVRAAPGPVSFLVAGHSKDAVTLDPLQLGARWQERGIKSDVFVPELLPELYPAERVATLESELARVSATVAPTHDNRPLSFLYALSLRQQMARSVWAAILNWGVAHPTLLQLVAIAPSSLLLAWFSLRRLLCNSHASGNLATLHATAVTGATGMALSLMLFFSFQTRVGALYSEVGLLSALFMLGLASGGAYAVRRRLSLTGALIGALAAAALLALSFSLLDEHFLSLGWAAILHGFLLALSGAATGAVFPSAATALLECTASARGAASATQFSDHAGAAIAAAVAVIVFMPILGLTRTALILCCLQALAVVTIMVTRRSSDVGAKT